MGRVRTTRAIKNPKVKAPRIKGTQLIRVTETKEPKWDVVANENLPDDKFYPGGSDFSYQSPKWEGDVGHGIWDDEDSKHSMSMGNRWTMPIQYHFLSRRQVTHKKSSLEGTAHGFLGAIPNIYMHHWPPLHKLMFIDMKGQLRTISPHLVGVESSPEDAPFPCMDKKFLDLGPNLCLDRCEPVVITPEIRLEFGLVLESKRAQLKRWFPNNMKDKSAKAILGVKLKADLKRPPSLQHVYSHLLYGERGIGAKVSTEAERIGVSPNNINVINRVTGEEWSKEPEEVKQMIKKLHEEQKALLIAIKERCIDDIMLTAEQKSAVIDSLGIEFDQVFKLISSVTGWGFFILGAGIDPETGSLRSSSWDYGMELKSGQRFFDRFDKDAAAGLVPGRLPGDNRKASAYFSGPLLAHMRNVERVQEVLLPKDHESASDSEPMDIDPMSCDVREEKDDVVVPRDDAPLPDLASEVVLHPSPTSDNDPLPQIVPSTKVVPLLPNLDVDPLPDIFPSTMVAPPSPTPNDDLFCDILSPANFSPSHFPNSSVIEAFPSQPTPEIDPEALLSRPSYSPEWVMDTSMLFMPNEGSSVYNDNGLLLPSSQESSFSSLEPGSLSLNTQAQSSDDGMDNTGALSDTIDWESFNTVLASFYAPGLSYSACPPPPFNLNMVSTQSGPPLPASPAAPPLHLPSGPAVPSSNQTVSANAITTAVHQKPTSNKRPVKASRCGPLNRPAEQMPIPDIPRQARIRKAPGSKEVTTLVSIEPSAPPPWQVQSLASMRDSTFGKDWDALLEKWDVIEAVLIRENSLGKLPMPKKQPSVLKKWLEGACSFNDPLVISDIDRFGVAMVGWWNSLQLNWRQTMEGMPLQKYAGPFTCLRKGGQNGIVTVLFGLFWWRRNCDGPSEWSSLMLDISDMFDALLNTTGPAKHRR